MADASFENIPSLDLEDFRSGNKDKRTKFVAELGNAFNNVGFVAIKNHGLSDELRNQLYDSIQKFFSLPEEIKKQYDKPELHGQRGYTSKGKEHAKGRTTGDLKEFFQIGQIVEDNDPIKSRYPDNLWPSEVEGMEKYASQTYKTLESAGQQILKAVALYLELPEDYFDAKVHYGNSILRAIHYFPIENPDAIPSDAVRAAEHGDINLITLLMGASAEGLEIKRRDGKWFPVTALPDQIVVNVGDMLARLTNDKLKSTIHRVVNPPKEKMKTSRYSIPFFLHPRSEMDLTCLQTCVSEENPKKYTDMTAGEFLDERLAEIGLKK
ncbi:2-oxoglutarate and iron-dependent oxygenase domain-containing protein [Porifericola rhodea]|uniref:isopenicillin N synthase family dioxygenase n=1 Tax=Porifericola rhodea TaxID=930972 RepID=UPI0026652FCF|nr:2-oxoglutarate and iron-dependent oxygenase domain-containing protein [Porifericola rhodea]WKN33468.1 2-oxoglutarate and iron-dependent oxygenase domain-containing protein [Porifericola rhodea]